MGKPLALVTGAEGEMGHLLLPALDDRGFDVVALDLATVDEALARYCVETVRASILDLEVVRDVVMRRRPVAIYHLAAVLSSKAEQNPTLAHDVNVQGSFHLFRTAEESARRERRPVRVLYPSSIAIYGLPDLETKRSAGALGEGDFAEPRAMYGCNKRYGEMLGAYMSERSRRSGEPGIDFRSIRFPGLISAETVPSGGTSDYGPEMIHAAVRADPYTCFVREDTRLPFMTMPDAVDAFLRLSEAPAERLTTRVYNVRAFAPTAGEFRDAILARFPGAEIRFGSVRERQAIVDSWPADVDDSRARRDWGLAPQHDLERALDDYLLPALRRRYAVAGRRSS